MTDVIFRTYPEGSKFEGDVIALFPAVRDTHPWSCSSYMHVGQHSEADPWWVFQNTRPSEPAEFSDLAKELRTLGYRLHQVTEILPYCVPSKERRK